MKKFNQFCCQGILYVYISLLTSCSHEKVALSSKESTKVTQNVADLITNIEKDLKIKGPVAWLTYFDDTPCFYMASEGALQFKDHAAAKTFIEGVLEEKFAHISLDFDALRIDPLTSSYATIRGDFRENLTDKNGVILKIKGYFTGLASLSANGWKIRNAHWSMKH